MAAIVALAGMATTGAGQRTAAQAKANESGPPGIAAKGSAQAPADLLRAMDERARAIFAVDPEAWDRLTADGFTVVQADGRLLSKADRLAELRRQRPVAVPPMREHHIQNHGDLVVHRLRSGDSWVLEVWARGPQGWQVTITQVTKTDGGSRETKGGQS
ncbi:MAG TPA: nuclear transport factor 2 family protein [Vicinamibacteria bacterium]|nr:nuclear transport factor 2 family protein [Vicinamibacteria bacterium]